MSKRDILFFLLFATCIISVFFAKTIFKGQVPLPGDLLVDTNPFTTESYLGFNPGSYPNKAQGRDVITQLYPWKYFSIEQIKAHNIALWNPYNFSGNVHMANYQTGFFYPLQIIFLFLPFVSAWTVFIMLQPILAMLFMYLYVKELQVGRLAAFLGAVAFGFSSYMIVWLEWGNIGHTLLWLPLVLFATKRFVKQTNIYYMVLLILAGAFCLTAGYIQGASYVLAVTFLYGILLLRKEKIGKIPTFYFIFSFVCMGILTSVQILPTITMFFTSARGAYSQIQIHNLLQPWYYPVTVLVSEFFGNPATRNFYLPITYFERVMYPGIPILFFALYACTKVKTFEVKFFSILALVVLITTTNLPGISYLYSLPIPIISTTVPTRLLSIFLFSIAVLAALGIQAWIETKDIKSKIPWIFISVYILLWLGLFVAQKINPQWIAQIATARHNLVLSTFFAISTFIIFFLRRRHVRLSNILLTLLVIADFYYLFVKFTPFTPSQLIYPQTPVVKYLQQNAGITRSWGYGSAYIPANYATYFGIYSADGYDPLFNKDYGLLLNSSVTGKVQLPLSRTDANIAPGYGTEDLKRNLYRQAILNLLGVKYILNVRPGNSTSADNDTFPPEKYSLIWHSDPWQIYENLKAFPRVFLANQYKIVTQDKAIDAIYTTDIAKTVLLYNNPSLLIDGTATGSATLVSYQPNTISISTHVSGNELLFLSDTYDEGWKATIDGKPTAVLKADVAFRAITVPKGSHKIVFFYQPSSFTVGLLVSFLSLIVGGSYLLIRRLL